MNLKPSVVRPFKESSNSFTYCHETKGFNEYHHHPEFELVFIVRGKGIRIIGDTVEKFEEGDLAFLGSLLPHLWRCSDEFFTPNGDFLGEGLIIQFTEDFLGSSFFNIPENYGLQKFLEQSAHGCEFHGRTKKKIIKLMEEMKYKTSTQRLYALFAIFEVLATSAEYKLIGNPVFDGSYKIHYHEPLRAVIQYTLQNFKEDIKLQDVLEIANMSRTQFFLTFKGTYKMSYKNYLTKVRIAYACKLLTEDVMNISQTAYESGFLNISNFNRQFRNIKGLTPTEYRHKLIENA